MATSESLISNINKETCQNAEDLNNLKLEKKENNKIPHKSKIVSKYSPKITKVPKGIKADSHIKVLTETYGFAIRMEDTVLLYKKDPRLRTNIGNQINNSNKFECLRNDFLYENKIFKEI